MKKKKIPYPIWHIRWKDAVYRLDSAEDPKEPLHCEDYDAVGFVIRDDKEREELEFVQEVCTDGTVRHRNVISYAMLIEYNVLRK